MLFVGPLLIFGLQLGMVGADVVELEYLWLDEVEGGGPVGLVWQWSMKEKIPVCNKSHKKNPVSPGHHNVLQLCLI